VIPACSFLSILVAVFGAVLGYSHQLLMLEKWRWIPLYFKVQNVRRKDRLHWNTPLQVKCCLRFAQARKTKVTSLLRRQELYLSKATSHFWCIWTVLVLAFLTASLFWIVISA